MKSNLQNEVCPDDMEHKEDGKKTIEYVVGREHFNHLRSLYGCTEFTIGIRYSFTKKLTSHLKRIHVGKSPSRVKIQATTKIPKMISQGMLSLA